MWNTRPDRSVAYAALACLALVACGESTSPPPALGPPTPPVELILRERIARDPSDFGARLELANHLFDVQRRGEAVPLYREVLEQRPGDPGIRTDLGTCLFGIGRNAEARAEYERVLREHPDHVNATFNLAVLDDDEGRSEEAALGWERVAAMTDDPRIAEQASGLAARARQRAESLRGRSP